MTDNMKILIDQVTTAINSEFGDTLPTLEQINDKADIFRSLFAQLYPMSDEEYIRVKKELATNILHRIGVATTLRGHDAEHQSWYFVQENDGYYWNRYKTYLKNVKHWGIDVVNRLNQTTDDILDDLGNPKDVARPFQRRGLLLGDVQSGKTATYTAICNKASDAGYRVIIVLAGMMENLRVQTQERLDSEFVGKESKYTLDKKAEQEIRNRPVGVGKIPPALPEKSIACFTSVATDFNKAILRAFNLNLRTLNGTALFVVKKNKSVLNNLYKWLLENNADHEGLIDLPLLLIDDEADNASVNTNSEEKDPTAINQAIRNILNCFRQASYLGITATPFANIFIDPDTDEATRDLFPKDFLTVLPTPELYIGADKIFGNGDADEWDDGIPYTRTGGIYGDSIIPIQNEEQEFFYVFKHKKELADELYDLPESMRKAIRYFILACTISDIRQDNTEHRSMLVNVSRFTKVQNVTADLIEAYVSSIMIAGTSVQVSSLQQFDRSDEGTLIVYFLDKTSSTGTTTISLNEAVEMVASKILTQANKDLLDLKLAKCGYQSKNADEYSACRFKLSEKRMYCVSSGFPRLTKDNVPPAVIEAQYRIDLPSIETFRKRED